MRPKAEAGFTVVELMVVLLILGIIWQIASPSYTDALELSRRDQAAGRLAAVFEAQRVYWVRHRVFASSLEELDQARLFDLHAIGQDEPFSYEIAAADSVSFEGRAVRRDPSAWKGFLSIDQSGFLTDEFVPDR